MNNLLSPLRIRAFRRLLIAYAVNALGNWAGQIALSVVVLNRTHNPAGVAGVMVAGQFLPSLLAPGLVARAEAVGARLMLPVLLAGEAGLFVVLAALSQSGSPAILLLVVGCDGVLGLTARALLKGSIVGVTSPRGLLREGNTLLMFVFTACMAAGPVAAGVMIGVLSPQAALVADAASFAAAALVVVGHAQRSASVSPADEPGDRLREALAHVGSRPSLRRLFSTCGMLGLASAAILPIEIVLVTRTLHASPASFGVVLALWGVGAAAGSALLPRLRHHSPVTLMSTSFAVMGIAYLGMGVAPSVIIVGAFSLLGGIGNGVEGYATMTAIQEQTTDAFQTRVAGLVESINAGTTGVGFLVGGLLAAIVSPRAVYVVSALAILACVTALVTPRAVHASPA
jgi:hypothetical protein